MWSIFVGTILADVAKLVSPQKRKARSYWDLEGEAGLKDSQDRSIMIWDEGLLLNMLVSALCYKLKYLKYYKIRTMGLRVL